jgi:hypothetical protein
MLRSFVLGAAVVVLLMGGVAFATGNQDQGNGVSAWAQIDPNAGSPLLVKESGIGAVSSPITGVYCLKAVPGIDMSQSAPVASEEANLSSTLGLVLPRRIGAPNSSCPVNQLQVDTFDAGQAGSPTLVNTVGFDVIVP